VDFPFLSYFSSPTMGGSHECIYKSIFEHPTLNSSHISYFTNVLKVAVNQATNHFHVASGSEQNIDIVAPSRQMEAVNKSLKRQCQPKTSKCSIASKIFVHY
jgi:hypothetical protein